MALAIVTDRAADADIDQQFAYIAERNFDAALRYYDAVGKTLERLAEVPTLGRTQALNNPRLTGMRRLAVAGYPNYLVFYIPTGQKLRVVRVLHGARDITTILDDLL